MNTEFVPILRLPRFQDVLDERESKINTLVNSLKIADVKEDTAFQANRKRIKEQVLLKPVSFEEPKIIDYQYSERQVSFVDQMNGTSRHAYVFQISVPFSGNSELISHACASPSFGSSERGIITPGWNGITLYVNLSADEPEQAKIRANQDLIPTIRNAESNNATVEVWNRTLEAKIDQALNTKRTNLIQKYGN